ncbi:MAG TPA: ATP-binding protein, partial [Ktedonobacteraceae bacterium]
MNTQHASIPTVRDADLSSTSYTRLQGGALVLARGIWIVGFVAVLIIFCVSIPAYVAYLHTISPGSVDVYAGQLTPGGLGSLHTLGLSLGWYIAYLVGVKVVFVCVWLTVGVIIFWRKSDDRMALFASFALVMFSVGFGHWTEAVLPTWWLPLQCVGFLSGLSIGLCWYIFPDGRFVPRWTLWPLIIATLIHEVSSHFLAGPLAAFPLLSSLDGFLFFGLLISKVAVQVYRYRRVSNAVQRQQTKWAVFGFAVAIVGFIGGLSLGMFFPSFLEPGTLFFLVQNTVLYLSLLFIPLSIGLAILRSHLWDIDIIIKRALVYGVLTACIVGTYVFVVGYLGALFRTGDNLLISLIATGLVAVLFQPLRVWLQRGVNRLLYGQRDEPYIVITRLSQRLEGALAPEAVLSTIVETVAQALRLPYAAILLKREGTFAEASSYGKPVSDPLTLPLTYQGATIGQLQLAPRAAGEVFTPADRRLLDELARQAGLAAHAVRLTADLQRSREHLVTAREEERRRLRRDLHDGLGATLAALHLQAGAIRTLMRKDLAAAEAEILDLQAEIRVAVADIRRLVYALRPPTLDELGLVGAIRQYAAQFDTANGLAGEPGMSLRVVVESPEQLPALPAAVEVAAYRVVQEALTNVVRHAQACSCRICLSLPDDGDLQVEITDDGVGLPKEPRAGVGLLSMRERAAEVGGSCVIEPAPGRGTRVLARLPFPKDVPTADLSEAHSSPSDGTKRSRDSGVGGLQRKD